MTAATTLASLLTIGLLNAGTGEDWPHMRGPGQDGRVSSAGAVAEGPIALQPVWRTPLGSAYSGVAVAGGLLVTLATDGEVDQVVALDAGSGAERWRVPLGPIYLGHDGSADGPISTPLIGLDMVFAIGARGNLLALDAGSGELRWSKHLARDLGATEPEYGFTTTPVLEGEQLIVQAGGSEGRLLCAFDARTGEQRWAAGEGDAAYQSPVVMDLAGRRQVVALNGSALLGVAPESGEVLWNHPLGEQDRAGTGVASPIDGSSFFANVSRSVSAYHVEWGVLPPPVPEVAPEGDGGAESGSDEDAQEQQAIDEQDAPAAEQEPEEGYVVTELYRSRHMGGSYAAPVHHEGHLYGYRGEILACIDASNGERVWRSRPPGGQGLILVDDRLFVFGALGVLAAVEASPEGYNELARVQALEMSSFTWPSYADGRVFVRNHQELVCVEVVAGTPPAVEVAAAASEAGTGSFAKFIEALEVAPDKQPLIDAFLAEQTSFPILEDGYAHFVFQGEVEDIALIGSMVDGSRSDAMARIEGTNFYHASYPIEDPMRWEYRFVVDFGDVRTDELNARTAPGERGEASELVTPGYEAATHLLEPAGEEHGRLEPLEFTSESLGNTRTLQVYLPYGYDASEDAYPLLLVHQGDGWLEQGQMANTLDNLLGTTVRPLVVVFIPPVQRWWYEAGGTGTDKYIDMLASEMVPQLEALYRLSSDPADRALMGKGGFGVTAGYATLRHPQVFGKAGIQSISLDDVTRHEFLRALEEGPVQDTSYYLDWNRYEARDKDRNYDLAEDGRRLWALFEKRGYPVAGGEALDGAGWGSWRSRADDLLVALFPME